MGRKPVIAYLGPQATFTHQAARRTFGEQAEYLPAETVDQVFTLVAAGGADRGVVPVENSNEGVVTSTMDLLTDSTLVVHGEIILPVRLMLLSTEESLRDVRVVYSHPQALAQSKGWLREHMPWAELKDSRSTAEAASRCASDRGSAAVAAELAAEIYGIPILERDVNDWAMNLTRFLEIAREPAPATGNDKTSIVFSIKDRVGALYEILKPFGERGINLTKIESRPSRRKAWDYVFFVDFEGHRDDRIVHDTLRRIGEMCVFMKVLGSYPKETVKEIE